MNITEVIGSSSVFFTLCCVDIDVHKRYNNSTPAWHGKCPTTSNKSLGFPRGFLLWTGNMSIFPNKKPRRFRPGHVHGRCGIERNLVSADKRLVLYGCQVITGLAGCADEPTLLYKV